MGCIARDLRNGELVGYFAKATLIATGGYGRIYRATTNAIICDGGTLLDVNEYRFMSTISVLSSASDDGTRQVKIRFRGADAQAQNLALEQFRDHPGLRYWAREEEFYLKPAPGKA